jgi:hypothetical protein
MKLGLKRGATLWANINRSILKTQWSHSAIEIDGRIYESTALKGAHPRAGVRDYPLTPAVAADFVWLELGKDGEAYALAAYERMRGHGYDYCSLLNFEIPFFLLPLLAVRDGGRAYCHELCALMMGIEFDGYKTPELLLWYIASKR